MNNTKEALIAVAVFLFIVSAVSLPMIIGYFTVEFKKRLKRLDEALSIFEETNKYTDGKEES